MIVTTGTHHRYPTKSQHGSAATSLHHHTDFPPNVGDLSYTNNEPSQSSAGARYPDNKPDQRLARYRCPTVRFGGDGVLGEG